MIIFLPNIFDEQNFFNGHILLYKQLIFFA